MYYNSRGQGSQGKRDICYQCAGWGGLAIMVTGKFGESRTDSVWKMGEVDFNIEFIDANHFKDYQYVMLPIIV